MDTFNIDFGRTLDELVRQSIQNDSRGNSQEGYDDIQALENAIG